MPVLLTVESLNLFLAMTFILIGIYKNKPNKASAFYALVFLPLLVISNVIDYDVFMLTYPIHGALSILFSKLAYPSVKLTSLIYIHIMLFALGAIFTSIADVFLTVYVYYVEVGVSVCELIVCAILSFSRWSTTIQQTIRCIPKIFKILILCICGFLAGINTLIYVGQKDFENQNWLILLQIFDMLIVASFFVFLPVVVHQLVKSQQLKQLTENYENQLETQAKHYEAVAKSNWEIRRFQHDTKNLTVGLLSLLENGQQQDALEMLNSYYESSLGNKDALLQFDTGNGIVDALLAEKQQTALKMNVTISFEGIVPGDGISPSHLCVLFGNTLDNALDACAKLPVEDKKTIGIVSKSMGGYFWLTVTNPVAENVKIKNNAIATTKEDKNHHGFGLYSLRKVAGEYQGEINLTCQNNLFKIAVELNMEA